MARTSSTAVATPAAADRSRPPATGSVTRSRAVSTCRRTPASAAPTPSCRSRRSRRRSSSRAVTSAARLCWSRSESRSAATAGATWSQTTASSSASRVGQARLPRAGGDAERADDLAAVPHRQPVAGPVGVPTAATGCAVGVVAENERGRAEPQRLDDHRADPLGRLGEVEALAQPGGGGLEDPRGIGAVAVEHPVDAPVQPDTERVEQQPARRQPRWPRRRWGRPGSTAEASRNRLT